MLCELSLLLNKKEGVEEQFPEVRENSLYEKLLNHLDRGNYAVSVFKIIILSSKET